MTGEYQLLHQLHGPVQIVVEGFGADLHRCHILLRILYIDVIIACHGNLPCCQIDLIAQLRISVMRRIHMAEHILKDSDIREILRRHILYPKHQPQISDTVGKHIVIQSRNSRQRPLFIVQRRRLPLHVFSVQKRDPRQILRRILVLSESIQGFHCIAYLSQLLLGHLCLLLRKGGSERILLSLRKPLLRLQDDHCGMGIIQKILLHQSFEIPFFHPLAQLRISIIRLYMDERPGIIVHPAAQSVQSIHQPLGKASEIRLSVLEFKMIDSRQKRFPVKSVPDDPLKHLPDGILKFLFPVR